MVSKWTRAGGAGAMLLAAAVAVSVVGAPSDAQTVPPVSIAFAGTNDLPDVSDDGNIVVFRSTAADGTASIQVHNRILGTTVALLDTFAPGVTNPAISANGCLVAFGSFDESTPPPIDPPATDPPVTDPPVTDPPVTDPPEPGAPSTDPPSGTDQPTDPGVDVDGGQTGESNSSPVSTTLAPGDDASAVEEDPVDATAASLQVASAATVHVVDRCEEPAVSVAELVVGGLALAPDPVLSADGGVLVVSDGNDILRLERTAAGTYGAPQRFDSVGGPVADIATRPEVAVSSDGSTVVFASNGPGIVDPTQSTLLVWNNGVVSVVSEGAWSPSLSADGRLLAYEDPTGVWLVELGVANASPIQLAPGGTQPSISADGTHVLHNVGGELRVISWTGSAEMPYGVTTSAPVSGAPNPVGSRGSIDAAGRAVVSDSTADVVDADIVVSVQSSNGSFSSELYDLGVGDVGAVLDATLTFTNDGPASLEVAQLLIDEPFEIEATDCTGSIRAGATCTIEVTFTVELFEDAFGLVTLIGAGVEAPVFTAEVTALGEAPPATTSPTTTVVSTTGGTTTGGTTTTGTTTGGTTTTGTTTGGSTTGGTSTSSTGTSSSSSTGGTATTTTVVPGAGVTFSPASFDFAPTIINDGRRVATIELVNASTTSVSVVGVRLEPSTAPFEIVETACAGESLAGNSRCSVDVAFAPVDEGAATVQVIAQLAGGVELEATLNGDGAPPPTLRLVPGVATVGQVITLRGAGFPTGVTVSVVLENGLYDGDVVVGDGGTFDVPIVLLPNTPQGPVAATVAAQNDQFGEVTTNLVITSTSDRSSPAVLDGVGPSIGR